MDNPVNKALIFEHFAGRETAIQRRLIEAWLREPGNIEQYYAWLEVWENQHPQYAVDVEAGLQRNLEQLQHQPAPLPVEPVMHTPNHFSRCLQWAAVLGGILLLGGLYI